MLGLYSFVSRRLGITFRCSTKGVFALASSINKSGLYY
jgi:hypothetical protein